ncbi:hypothetical protein TGARI_370530 [Toxoplasma gondii ARI]|nr:hypothetical protein TGARI_370530 [Toxoplasma gondii ARI]
MKKQALATREERRKLEGRHSGRSPNREEMREEEVEEGDGVRREGSGEETREGVGEEPSGGGDWLSHSDVFEGEECTSRRETVKSTEEHWEDDSNSQDSSKKAVATLASRPCLPACSSSMRDANSVERNLWTRSVSSLSAVGPAFGPSSPRSLSKAATLVPYTSRPLVSIPPASSFSSFLHLPVQPVEEEKEEEGTPYFPVLLGFEGGTSGSSGSSHNGEDRPGLLSSLSSRSSLSVSSAFSQSVAASPPFALPPSRPRLDVAETKQKERETETLRKTLGQKKSSLLRLDAQSDEGDVEGESQGCLEEESSAEERKPRRETQDISCQVRTTAGGTARGRKERERREERKGGREEERGDAPGRRLALGDLFSSSGG